MASELRVNTSTNRVGLGTITYTDTGPIISGITTGNNFKTGTTNVHSTGVELVNINTAGGTATFGGAVTTTGNVNIAHGTGQAHYQITQTNGNTVKMGIVSGSDFEISGSSNNNIIFKRAGSTRLTVTSSGIDVSGTVTSTGDVSIADKIVHTGDTNTFIRFPAADTFSVETAGDERLRITSGGDVGVGNNSPNCRLAVKDVAEHTAYNSVTPSVGDCMLQLYNNPPNETANDHATLQFGVNGGSHNRVNSISAVAESAGNRKMAFTFCTDEAGSRTEKLRITGDGQVRIGNPNNLAAWGQNNRLQVAGTDWSSSGVTIASMVGSNIPPNLVFGKSRGSTPGTAISNGDRLGYISFTGDDGTDMHTVGAAIVAATDAAPSSNSISGILQFYTGGNSTERLRIASDGTVTIGDGNELASSYGANLLVDGGSSSQLTLVGSTTGTGKISFADGSGSAATKNAGIIYMDHNSTDNGPRLTMGLADVTMLHLRSPGSNRGQLEVYGSFNESTSPAIEINHGNDARKVYLTNSSGDFNALTRNAGQTKGQLKMFESGILLHNMKDPNSTNVLQTFRTGVYKVTTGSTNTSTSPVCNYFVKGGAGSYDAFEEGNCVLEVNGSSSSDNYQPVAFVPRGYNLDSTSFGGQWAGEMWIHQDSSQNPQHYGYSGYNNWSTMSFKCRWDLAHWNAKPNGFWVEHYINYGRAQIGKIDTSGSQSQFVIYLLPGSYRIRYNCVRGVSVHRAVSAGGGINVRDGSSFVTYGTLSYSSRNTAFDSEITPGSASGAYTT